MPKLSLNKWYAGVHWSKRKQIKDIYKLIIKSQFKAVFSKLNKYRVDYTFCFKSRPLDASNCVAMVKLVEDVIFEDDNPKVITEITIKSRKATKEELTIKVSEL